MKKRFLVLAAAMVVTASVVTACGSGAAGSNTSGNANSAQASQQTGGEVKTGGDGYVFKANGTSLSPDADMDSLKEKLGKDKSVFEAPSCAGQGTAYTYDYGSFTVETYPAEDKKNRIGYITLKDDMVSTAEGIDLSATKDQVKAKYGEPDASSSDTTLIYKKGSMKLEFIFDGASMKSIQYVSSVLA